MNIKAINLLGNLILVITFVLGALHLSWLMILACAIALTIIRILYIKAEQKLNIDHENNQTSAPQNPAMGTPMVRTVASFITASLMAGIIFAIGYGVRYAVNLMIA